MSYSIPVNGGKKTCSRILGSWVKFFNNTLKTIFKWQVHINDSRLWFVSVTFSEKSQSLRHTRNGEKSLLRPPFIELHRTSDLHSQTICRRNLETLGQKIKQLGSGASTGQFHDMSQQSPWAVKSHVALPCQASVFRSLQSTPASIPTLHSCWTSC